MHREEIVTLYTTCNSFIGVCMSQEASGQFKLCLITVSVGFVAKLLSELHQTFFTCCSLSFLCVKSLSQSPLVQAIFSRNAEEVTFLLSHNEDVNSLVILQ